MSTEFKREERYIVFKLSDVEEHFTPGEKQQLARLAEVQRVGRSEAGKPLLECVVVEADWPEYEPTWNAIEARMTGAQPAPYQSNYAGWKTALYALPGAQAQNVPKAVAYLDLGVGGYMDIGTEFTDEELATLPKGRHMLGIVGTYGVDGYVPAQPAPSFADAYQGAMEDVAIWKKRALEAEDLNRKFVAEINGPAYTCEPAQPAASVPVEAIGKMLADAMTVAVSNGANSVSMPDEYVEVAVWLRGISPQPTPARSA